MTSSSPHSDGRPLRVHFIGNTCNNHYVLAKALRQQGVDAHLFYNAGGHWQTHPAADDDCVVDNAPDWLHPYCAADEGPTPLRGPRAVLARQIADCEVIHAEDIGVIWAAQSGKPYVWDPYGYDMKFYGFNHYWQQHWHGNHPERVLAPLAFRQAVAGTAVVSLGLWYSPLRDGAAMIDGLVQDRFRHEIALATDIDVFSPGTGRSIQELLALTGSSIQVRGLTVFHPVRMMFTGASYVNKANDRLIRAVGRLHAAGHEITLVLSQRDTPCEPAAKSLIAELGLSDRVAWIPSMPRRDLVEWYRAADVTADEFEGGAMGSVAFESLACGTPLITRLIEEDADPTFWSPQISMPVLPPLIPARTDDDIVAGLLRAITDRDWLRTLAVRSRAWMQEYGSPAYFARKWMNVYADILTKPSAISAHGWRRPLPAMVTQTPDRDQVVEQLLNSRPVVLAELMAAFEQCPDDPRIIAGIVALLHRSGAGAFANSVLEYAAELLPESFPGVTRTVAPPLPPALAECDDPTLSRHVQDALSDHRFGEALAALDTLRDRYPQTGAFEQTRRDIVTAVTPSSLRLRRAS